MPVNKHKGKNLSLTIEGVEFNAAGTQVVLTNEEAEEDDLTFADLSSGTAVDWYFELTALADYGAGSFWDALWTGSGTTVPYVFKPYGNTQASTSQPHFTGDVTINAKPPIGGTAGETWSFEARLDCTGEPVRKVS